MKFPRSAGILLHPTSLPGPHGIGDLGAEALRFLDWLAECGVSLWQVLPLGPTGYGDSPYQCFSAFAGNPLLIAGPDEGSQPLGVQPIDYATVIPRKRAMLKRVTDAFEATAEYKEFVRRHAAWLEDYALFMAAKDAHGGVSWTQWPADLAQRESSAMDRWRERLSPAIEARRIEQYLFFSQFDKLQRAAQQRGIRIMGDVPIYVAHDSADVWANPEFFQLNADGTLKVQAGVPPDYFSATGQLWGNPLYEWERLHSDGYRWWIERMRAAFHLFDLVRIDHFRGFEAFWEVAGASDTAVDGRWVPGPGRELFDTIARELGPLPIVAENLGLITPEVEALRQYCGFPGMSILQFAFGSDGQANDFQPHTFPRERVVYTGTHDNDTTLGWWESTGEGDSTRSADDVAREKKFALDYLGADGTEMNWTLIRAGLASVADTVLIPMQDVLGLGSDARMNLPGRTGGNWRFRFAWEDVTPSMSRRLRSMIAMYGRRPSHP